MHTRPATRYRKSLSGSAVPKVAEALAAAAACNLPLNVAALVAEALETCTATTPQTNVGGNEARCAFLNMLGGAVDAARQVAERRFGNPYSWHLLPHARWRIRVPEEVNNYVRKDGKVDRSGSRNWQVPAPWFWPGGKFPPGAVDLGPLQSFR